MNTETTRLKLLEKIEQDIRTTTTGAYFKKEKRTTYLATSSVSIPPGLQPDYSSRSFGQPKTERLFMSVATPVIVGAAIVHYHQKGIIKAPVAAGIVFLVVIYIPMLVYYWLSDRFRDRITFTREGIIFENYYYRWGHILTTHVKTEIIYQTGHKKNQQHYLTLGMDNGSLINICIDQFSFTKKPFTVKKNELLALCLLVEYFRYPVETTASRIPGL